MLHISCCLAHLSPENLASQDVDNFQRSFCVDLSSPQISARLFGHYSGENDSLCKSLQFCKIAATTAHKCKTPGSQKILALPALSSIPGAGEAQEGAEGGAVRDGLDEGQVREGAGRWLTTSPQTKNPQTTNLSLSFWGITHGPRSSEEECFFRTPIRTTRRRADAPPAGAQGPEGGPRGRAQGPEGVPREGRPSAAPAAWIFAASLRDVSFEHGRTSLPFRPLFHRLWL